MAQDDLYGEKITTTSPDAAEHFRQGMTHFLSSNYGALEAFDAAIAADSGFAMGHAGRARALMGADRGAEAKAALAAATELASGASSREREHIALTTALMDGNTPALRAAIRAHVRDHPRDALIAQLATSVFGLIGFSGEVAREAALLAYTEALLPHYGEDWWALTVHAISLCETGQLAESDAVMDRALALNPRNANAAHFRSHALYEEGRTEEGRAYLGDWTKDYDPRGNMNGHLQWHLALWALHAGDEAAMWDVFDAKIAPDAPGIGGALRINTVTDSASLLFRAELAGFDVAPARWAEVSRFAQEFFPDPGQSFIDMHAALAHAMSGNGEALARLAETRTGFAADIVAPVATAFGHMARETWTEALEAILPALPEQARLGGSRAQRDLIELAYVQILARLGLAEEAGRALRLRRPVLASAPPIAALH